MMIYVKLYVIIWLDDTWYDKIYGMIYLLTAIELTPGGSSEAGYVTGV
jgi:hypothetical protein